jgi:hypothetical protein
MLGLILLSLSLRAETVLMQSVDSSTREYQARLAASPHFVPPSSAYLRLHPSAVMRERLLARYAEAQKAFLQNPAGVAIARFEEVIRLLPEEDWSKPEREVFLFSFLRLAQLDSSKQVDWLTQSLDLGPGLVPDRSLFPPPLLARLEELRRSFATVSPAGVLDSGDWQRILINGVSCTVSNCPSFADTKTAMRVTLLSDKWTTHTLHIRLTDLPSANPAREPWVQGRCGAPVLHASANAFPDHAVFFGLACEEEKPLNLQAKASSSGIEPFTMSPPSEPTTKLLKNKWFWAGLGAVGVAVAISASQHKHDQAPTPTTTYGN